MVSATELNWSKPWLQIATTEADWDAVDGSWILTTFKEILIIRRFEEALLGLSGDGLVNGPMHSSIGQEGGAVGSASALLGADAVNGSHRAHHQFLAKSLAYLNETQGALKNDTELAPSVIELLYITMAEILGLAPGHSGGRGGSMHLRWKDAGCLGTNAIVGGGVPLALGNAWAQRHEATRDKCESSVTFTYFGDGAANIGSVLESFNLASAWKLPVCFFIENNLYAVSTHINEASAETRLSARGPGFAIPSWRVDGMDPLAVKLATEQALQIMRDGGGPTLIEAEVYRFYHQNGPFAGSAFGYRKKDEERAWKLRDPLVLVRKHLERRAIWKTEDMDAFDTAVKETVSSIVSRLVSGEPPSREIRPELWPDASTVDNGVRSSGTELENLRTAPTTTGVAEMKFSEAIARVLGQRMATDDSIVILGEDIHRLNGGTDGATKGLVEIYPDRILGTPISENAFSGLGGGLASTGRFKPIVEFMFADFILVAADQLFNQIGKMRHMFGGSIDVPLVLRIKVGIGHGYGSQHSMDPTSIFTNFPGWRIVAPSTSQDYIAAMNSALALNDPVAILEHVQLYDTVGEIPDGDLDYYLPLRSGALRTEGDKATVISYLAASRFIEDIAAEQDLDIDLIDLRWLDSASMDWDLIEKSVRKTNRVLIVEQGTAASSYGGWLSHEIQSRFFDYLDHEIIRVTGSESSPTISRALEAASGLSQEKVLEALATLTKRTGAATGSNGGL